MKHELYYVLSATNDGIKEVIDEFKEELNNLDPSANYKLIMILAKLQGVSNYTDERVQLHA